MSSNIKRASVSGPLYRMIYCSRNVQPTAAADVDEEIRAILVASRRCNKADNVTGALLLTVSGFAQVLEGPREVVERTFERIAADARHSDVTVLSFTPTETRSFPEWPMAFSIQTSDGTEDPLTHLLADATFAGPRATTGSDVLRLLENVAYQEDEWISA